MNLLSCQVSTFYCPLRKKRCILCTLPPHGTDRCTHSADHSSKRFKSFLSLYYYGKIIVELGKHKQGIQLCLQCLKSIMLYLKVPISSTFSITVKSWLFGFIGCIQKRFFRQNLIVNLFFNLCLKLLFRICATFVLG